MSLTVPIAEWLERHAGKQGVPSSITGGGTYFHTKFWACFQLLTVQMKSSITFIQSNGCTEIDFKILKKKIRRRFVCRHVSFKIKFQSVGKYYYELWQYLHHYRNHNDHSVISRSTIYIVESKFEELTCSYNQKGTIALHTWQVFFSQHLFRKIAFVGRIVNTCIGIRSGRPFWLYPICRHYFSWSCISTFDNNILGWWSLMMGPYPKLEYGPYR